MSEPPRTGPAAPSPLPRRFYKTVTVEALAGETSGGDRLRHRVLLDGRPLRTPAKGAFVVPGHALASAVAAEWAAQGEHIDPTRMPLTRIANAAIDGVVQRRAEVVADICSYAGSDLLCYRADAPEGLVERQRKAWDPVLAWAAQRLHVAPRVGSGVVHVAQPPEIAEAVRGRLSGCDDFVVAGLHVVTTLTGSALLALALLDGALAGDAVWQAAHVDEDFQIAQWGEDAEALDRRAARRVEFDTACALIALVG